MTKHDLHNHISLFCEIIAGKLHFQQILAILSSQVHEASCFFICKSYFILKKTINCSEILKKIPKIGVFRPLNRGFSENFIYCKVRSAGFCP